MTDGKTRDNVILTVKERLAGVVVINPVISGNRSVTFQSMNNDCEP